MSWFTALGSGGAAAGSTVGAGAIGAGAGGSLAAGGAATGASGLGILAPQGAGPAVGGFSLPGGGANGAIPNIGGGGAGQGAIPGLPQMPSIGAVLEGATSILQGVTAHRQAEAESDLVKGIGIENDNRVYAGLAGIAHKGVAIEGAQNAGDRGSSYQQRLENMYAAALGARAELLPYQAQAKAIKKAGDLALRQGIMRGGTSHLTGR